MPSRPFQLHQGTRHANHQGHPSRVGAEINIEDDGLVHVSELAEGRAEKVEDIVKKAE